MNSRHFIVLPTRTVESHRQRLCGRSASTRQSVCSTLQGAMLPLVRRWRLPQLSTRCLSSATSFKLSNRLRKASLLKVWNEAAMNNDSIVVGSLLAEAVELDDKSLVDVLVCHTSYSHVC